MSRLLVLALAICLARPALAALPVPVAPELYGALPSVSDADLSPNGRHLATLRNDDAGTIVAIRDLDAMDVPARATRIEGVDARELRWANDDVLLLLVSRTVRRLSDKGMTAFETWRWLAMDRANLQSRVLFDDEPGYYIPDPGKLLALVPDEPNRVVFSRWTSQGGSRSSLGSRLNRSTEAGVSLFSVQLDKAKVSMHAGGNAGTQYWRVDAKGEVLARIDEVVPTAGSGAVSELQVLLRRDSRMVIAGRWQLRAGSGVPMVLYGPSVADGRLLAGVVRDGRESLVVFDAETGELGETVFTHPRHGFDSVLFDARVAAVRGVSYVDDLPRHHYFDAADQRLQASLSAALPGASPLIVSRSADGSRRVVKVVYSDHPPQWFLFDAALKQLDMLASSYQALDTAVHARKERFEFAAADGLTIPGYLTVPAGASRKSMPLVVLPHGGPAARDDQAFDYWSFFYAARGYLVYQPNFRGSTGYGTDFTDAGDGQWGRRIQDDISEGVRALVAAGIADPARVCIVGASFGGYLALSGATLSPELYACAVSVNGFSNVGDLIGASDNPSRGYWEARVGARTDRKALHAISPMHQAARAKAPILLVHGKDDTVVPIGQSRAMAKALAAQGKPHALVELAGEDHWLSSGKSRTEMLARSIEFIDRHIGPATPARAE